MPTAVLVIGQTRPATMAVALLIGTLRRELSNPSSEPCPGMADEALIESYQRKRS